jgi:hypothetical protein
VFGIIAVLVTAREQQASQEKRTQSKFHETDPFDKRLEDYIDNATAL